MCEEEWKELMKAPVSRVDTLDKLVGVRDLIEVCIDTLTNSRLKNHKALVANILHFSVLGEIETILEEGSVL